MTSLIRLPMRSVIAAALIGSAAFMTQSAVADSPNQIHVSAEGSVNVPPDMATLNADLEEQTPGVPRDSSNGADAQALTKARNQLEHRFSGLYQKIRVAGIPEKDIQAGSLTVQQDQYSVKQSDDSKNSTPMVRTQLSRPLTLTIHDLDKVPAVLNALTAAGVNQLSGVKYGLSHPEKAQDEALHQAVARALDKARIMASALGVSLGDVMNVEQEGGQIYHPMMMMARSAAPAQSQGNTPADYHQGEINQKTTVNIVWGIRQ